MKYINDNAFTYDNEAAYMPMAGLADTATATPADAAAAAVSVPWYQAIGADIAQIVSATKSTAPATTATATTAASSAATTQKWLIYGAVGIAGIFALSLMMNKKRRR